ncbi:MAG TPA: type II toxin-antitoxin system PemK/MazF family toxin [Tepidisphaeraceae bacterium]|jgi:mRNA-degrading endonuclease toxin of MazEF toxin-antitoxin module
MPGPFPHRGEIWLVDFPDDPKSRPALIVSPNSRNEFANSVLAVPITTNLRPSPTHLLLAAGQGGLSFDSMARCENVSYIHKSRLRRGSFTGTIGGALMHGIEQCLLRAFGIVI